MAEYDNRPIVFKRATPCRECPWKRTSFAGWLGPYTAQEFVDQVRFDGPPHPCHCTVDPTKTRGTISMCAGALIFMANNIKSVRHPGFATALDENGDLKVEADTATVFQWFSEFEAHHGKAK